jgi:hypothetical protein
MLRCFCFHPSTSRHIVVIQLFQCHVQRSSLPRTTRTFCCLFPLDVSHPYQTWFAHVLPLPLLPSVDLTLKRCRSDWVEKVASPPLVLTLRTSLLHGDETTSEVQIGQRAWRNSDTKIVQHLPTFTTFVLADTTLSVTNPTNPARASSSAAAASVL